MSASENFPFLSERTLKPAYRAMRRLAGDVRENSEKLFATSIYILELSTAIGLAVATRGLASENPYKVDAPAVRHWEGYAKSQFDNRFKAAQNRNKVTHIIYS